MDFSKRLQDEIDTYNALVEDEHKAEKTLLEIREKRTIQLGKVRAVEELYKEQLEEASKAASKNGKVGSTESVEIPIEEKNAA